MSKFTEGPWKWVVNKKHKIVHLEGRSHEIMRFERYGMQSAQPTFLTDDKRFQCIKAVDLACDIKGREHHASWHQGIDHPDARLIESAPNMYEALEMVVRAEYLIIPENVSPDHEGEMQALSNMMRSIKSALAKADGKGE